MARVSVSANDAIRRSAQAKSAIRPHWIRHVDSTPSVKLLAAQRTALDHFDRCKWRLKLTYSGAPVRHCGLHKRLGKRRHCRLSQARPCNSPTLDRKASPLAPMQAFSQPRVQSGGLHERLGKRRQLQTGANMSSPVTCIPASTCC